MGLATERDNKMYEDWEYLIGSEGSCWRVYWREAMAGVCQEDFDTIEEAMAFIKDLQGESK
jgi:hypothetical protein